MIPLGWKAAVGGAALATAFAGGYAYRGEPPAPAVHAVEDMASQRASTTASDTSDSKGAARITTTVEEFGEAAGGASVPSTSGVAPAVPTTEHPIRRTVTVEERGPEVITQHATEQKVDQEQAHVNLTVTPAPAPPGWAIGAGVSLPGRQLRLELDRRLFGNLWLTAGVVPARAELGIGLRMEW